jgi:hypothetical protein
VKISWKSGMIAGVLALSATMTFAGAPAEAQALSFKIKNVTTGKCLKWNGTHHAITQVKCDNSTMKQQWGSAGGQLISLSNTLPGQDCMTGSTKHEKKVEGRACYEVEKRRTAWNAVSFNRGAKTPIVNPLCGLLKTTPSGAVTCGKKVAGNRDEWIID